MTQIFVRHSDRQLLDLSRLASAHPEWGFSTTVDPSFAAELGYAVCEMPDEPSIQPWQTVELAAVGDGGNISLEWVVSDLPNALDIIKSIKRHQIMNEYEAHKKAPVLFMGVSWRGGFESAQGIDGWTRMAQRAGLEELPLTADNGNKHVVTIEQALDVAFNVGIAYQAVFDKKEELLMAVNGATTTAEVLAIEW